MSIGNSLRTIETPMGSIVCEMDNDPNYPSFQIVLFTPGKEEALLAVVEYDRSENRINLRSYFDPCSDEPSAMEAWTPETLKKYLSYIKGGSQ